MVVAASMAGLGHVETTAPVGTVLAECFDGQTLDIATGACPENSPVPGAASPTDPSGQWGPAVQEAEAANTSDESLAGNR